MSNMPGRTTFVAATVFALAFAEFASAQEHPTYQSLWDAVANDPDCRQQDDVDLTIVSCDKAQTQWYFTKPGHPAHPGVIKEQPVEEQGGVSMRVNGWSFASDADQPAFETFLAQIEALNNQLREMMAEAHGALPPPPPIALGGNWQPQGNDNHAVISLSTYYFALELGGHTDKAYLLLDAGLRSMMPYSQYSQLASQLNDEGGGVKSFTVKDIDWEKDPKDGPTGTYAAADFIADTDKGQLCGYLAWRKADDGFFTLVREETNILPSTLSDDERAKLKAQFHCVP